MMFVVAAKSDAVFEKEHRSIDSRLEGHPSLYVGLRKSRSTTQSAFICTRRGPCRTVVMIFRPEGFAQESREQN